ncbi:MAG: type II toxin-antitoxin system Phd/YefM family antitoxin [Verrucomicrobia bacterium]|nr:MAG: type II toxin-antitoxin system Phd/YefM family antitoxin [Verrucomicrobiota bacterium]
MAKLESLSDSRAKRVVSLIEDLTELEALENAADLKAARDALGESEKPLPWEQVKAKLDAQFGLPQQTS